MIAKSVVLYSAAAALLSYTVIYRIFFHPLARVPGPWPAKITKLWFVWQIRKGKSNEFMPQLHKNYGSIVRVAPDQVLCNSEEAIRKAYSAGTTFIKGDWYQACAAPDKKARGDEHFDLLTEMDKEKYRQQRRAIGPAYSIAGMEKHEDLLSNYIEKYVSKLQSLGGKQVDLPEWTHIFALDALSWFTLSKSLDYTSQENDGGNLASSETVWGIFTMIGMFPWLVKAMHSIPVAGPLLMVGSSIGMGFGIPKMWPICMHLIAKLQGFRADETPVGFCVPETMERIQSMESMRKVELPANRPGLVLDRDTRTSTTVHTTSEPGEEKDLLATLMQLHHNKEAQFNPGWAIGIALTNFGAGHDTIMLTLGVCLYNLAKHPETVSQLRETMKEHGINQDSKYGDIVKHVPLFHAVLKESLRMFPPLGMYMPRVVPEAGATISDTYLPPKTTVGINLWATHHNPDLFPDPSSFKPSRWLQDGTEESKKAIGRMDTFWFGFGGQSRSCPGQYLGRFFVIKVMARLVQEFNFEVNGDPDFGGWFATMMRGPGVRFVSVKP